MSILNTNYKTDVSDAEWAIIAPLIPPEKPHGRHRSVDMRAVFNAIAYWQKTGCSWEMLPKDFPPSSTVYCYWRKWQKIGWWEDLNRSLREQLRQQEGRNPKASAASADSQSVKTAEKRGKCTGLMVARKSKGESVTSW